jgi:deoxyribose-phosphate aldolase
MNSTIDLAVLHPTQIENDVVQACKIAYEYKLASVCVRPYDITLAKTCLCNTSKISTVVDFPHGNNTSNIRQAAAVRAIDDGANELDVVIQIGKFLRGLFPSVEADLKRIVRLVAPIPVKVIIETGYLNQTDILLSSTIAKEAGAAFVKSCTGFGPRGVTIEDVDIMTSVKDIQVKASGGIKTKEQAKAFIDKGCTRLGIGLNSILDIIC